MFYIMVNYKGGPQRGMAGKGNFPHRRCPDAHVVSPVFLFAGQDIRCLGKIDLPGDLLLFPVADEPVGYYYKQLIALIFFFRKTIHNIKFHSTPL